MGFGLLKNIASMLAEGAEDALEDSYESCGSSLPSDGSEEDTEIELLEKDENWLSCKYTIEMEITFSDGEVRKLHDNQILGLLIEKDYDHDHLPILMVDLSLSRLDRNKVDDETEFHTIIKQYYLQNDDDSTEKISPKIYLDEKFVRIGYGTQPDIQEDLEKQVRESNRMTPGDVSPNDNKNAVTYALFKKSDLLMSKYLINDVVANASMQDLVTWILTEAKCDRKVLMSIFTNTEVYEELLLQPKPLLQQLIFLEQEFGWHVEGTYLFLDYDTFYIIRKNGKITAWKCNQPKDICFYVSSSSANDESCKGIIRQNNTVYTNIGMDGYKMIDAAIVDSHTVGSNLILFNTTTGKSNLISSGTTTLSQTGTHTTKMYHGHNPYVETQFKRMRKENDHVWDVSMLNTDISLFTPEKRYSFLSNVTKIGKTLEGSYRISGLRVVFAKHGTAFDNFTSVRIKRTDML